MTASCGSRTTSASRPESPLSSWSFVGILLVVLVFLLPTSTDACGDPPRYESMMLKGPPAQTYSPGDSVEYQCRPGYRRSGPGPLSSVCQPDNTWEPLQEACTKKLCRQLPDPVNGQVDGTLQFGSVLHYTCNEGYYLVGEATLYCELSGDSVDWSAEPPQCERILCQPPKQITNGITSTQKEIYEYNEVVTYSCISGPVKYSLIGERTLICSGHNEWSSDPPECKVVICPNPVPLHGELVSGHKTQFSYQDKVQLGCKKGYYLQGTETVACGANNTWEPPLPQCLEALLPPSTKPPLSTTPGPGSSATPTRTSRPGRPAPTSTPSIPSTSTPSIPPTSSPGTLGGGVIAAIVICVVAVIATIFGCCLYRHKKKKGKTEVNAEYRPYQNKASTPEQTH